MLVPLVGAIAALGAPRVHRRPGASHARTGPQGVSRWDAFDARRWSAGFHAPCRAIRKVASAPARRVAHRSRPADATPVPAPATIGRFDALQRRSARAMQPDKQKSLAGSARAEHAPSSQVAKAREVGCAGTSDHHRAEPIAVAWRGWHGQQYPLPRSAVTATLEATTRGPSIAPAGAPGYSAALTTTCQQAARLRDFAVGGPGQRPDCARASAVRRKFNRTKTGVHPATDEARVVTNDSSLDRKPWCAARRGPRLPAQAGPPRTGLQRRRARAFRVPAAVASGASGSGSPGRTPAERATPQPSAGNKPGTVGGQADPQPFGGLQTLLSGLGQLLQGRQRTPAPSRSGASWRPRQRWPRHVHRRWSHPVKADFPWQSPTSAS